MVEVLNSRPCYHILSDDYIPPLLVAQLHHCFLLVDMTVGRKHQWHNLIVVGVSLQYDVRNNTNVLHSEN